jgi:hypothetical protein
MSSTPVVPAPSAAMRQFWDLVVSQMVQDPTVPLFIRQRGGKGRGSVMMHSSGRELLLVDNAPANFFLSAAIHGHQFTVPQLMAMLASGQLPVAIILTRVERQNARFTGSQRRNMTPPNLNTLRFRVDHRVSIGLNAPLGSLATLPIEDLENHTKLFLSVSNVFLSPI